MKSNKQPKEPQNKKHLPRLPTHLRDHQHQITHSKDTSISIELFFAPKQLILPPTQNPVQPTVKITQKGLIPRPAPQTPAPLRQTDLPHILNSTNTVKPIHTALGAHRPKSVKTEPRALLSTLVAPLPEPLQLQTVARSSPHSLPLVVTEAARLVYEADFLRVEADSLPKLGQRILFAPIFLLFWQGHRDVGEAVLAGEGPSCGLLAVKRACLLPELASCLKSSHSGVFVCERIFENFGSSLGWTTWGWLELF